MTQHKEFPLCRCCDQEQTLSRISLCSVPLSPNQGVQGIYGPSKTGSVVLGGAGVLHTPERHSQSPALQEREIQVGPIVPGASLKPLEVAQ